MTMTNDEDAAAHLRHSSFRSGLLQLLVKPQAQNPAAQLLQRIESLRPAAAGIAREVVEALLPRDDDEMRHPAGQLQFHDDWISAQVILIDELVRADIFVRFPHAV